MEMKKFLYEPIQPPPAPTSRSTYGRVANSKRKSIIKHCYSEQCKDDTSPTHACITIFARTNYPKASWITNCCFNRVLLRFVK